MKRVLKTAVAVSVVLATSASAYQLWVVGDGAAFPVRESVLATNPDANGGPFFTYDDSKENEEGCTAGTSHIANNPPTPSTEEDVFGPWLDGNKGLIEFVTTEDCKYAFVGVGFKWIDTGEAASQAWNPTDVATNPDGDAEGISLCYSLDNGDMEVDLSVTDATAIPIKWDTYAAPLAVTAGPTHVKIPWSAFAQHGFGPEIGFEEYIRSSTGIQFKFYNPGMTGNFHLYAVGWYNDENTCDDESPIIPVSKQAGFSLIQHGRTLTFSGLSSNLGTVEVINMQGKLVSKAEISPAASTMSLNNLSTGIYMVRANNYTQKIIIK